MIPKYLEQYDYRTNLIVDRNNPILIQKAIRDRFSGRRNWEAGYGGEAYLGRKNSEDALTWNVFRSLQCNNRLDIVSKIFKIGEVRTILFWGVDPEYQGEEQQLTNIMIRTIDGKLRGTLTDPDLVVFTEKEVCFIECKLNQKGKSSPWKTRSHGSEQRMKIYVDKYPELETITEWRSVYHMIRQYVYAKALAEILDKTPRVFPLVNEKHMEIISNHYKTLQESSIQDTFGEIMTWQQINRKLDNSKLRKDDQLIKKITESLDATR